MAVAARRIVAQQRRALERRRRHERQAAAVLSPEMGHACDEEDEIRSAIDRAIARLSPGRREAVMRYFLAGKSQATIAAELDCSIAAVKTRIHEGVSEIRLYLARRGYRIEGCAVDVCLAGMVMAVPAKVLERCLRLSSPSMTGPVASALAHSGVASMASTVGLCVCGGILSLLSLGTARPVQAVDPGLQQTDVSPAPHVRPIVDAAGNPVIDGRRRSAGCGLPVTDGISPWTFKTSARVASCGAVTLFLPRLLLDHLTSQ